MSLYNSHLCYLFDALLAGKLFEIKPLNVSLGPLPALAYCCSKEPLHHYAQCEQAISTHEAPFVAVVVAGLQLLLVIRNDSNMGLKQ